MHYRALIRLAALLVSDVTIAEEVVQDAFVAMHSAWRQLRDSDAALSYLKRTVVSRSRSHRRPVRPDAGQVVTYPEPDPLAALRALPPRQREALVLRYYADFPETQVAAVMGISTRAVNNHIARGMVSLQVRRPGADRGRLPAG
jgi:DNA-directed RNA polymerase specialized sigma24 family protein